MPRPKQERRSSARTPPRRKEPRRTRQRKPSRFCVRAPKITRGGTVQLDDFKEPDEGPEYQGGIPVQKPGIKPNQIIDYETKAAYRAQAPSRVEEKPLSSEVQEQEDSPGGKFRKGTAARKVVQQEESDGENIEDSWGEIKKHVKRGKHRTSPPTRLGEDIRRRKKNIDGAHRSASKRNSCRSSRSSYESGSSQKRATGVFRTEKNRYRNVHIRNLPSRLRQTLPRETDPPPSLKYDPATIPKAKEKDDMGRVADVLLTLQGGKWEMSKSITSI